MNILELALSKCYNINIIYENFSSPIRPKASAHLKGIINEKIFNDLTI